MDYYNECPGLLHADYQHESRQQLMAGRAISQADAR
jgi:hypothetical protein